MLIFETSFHREFKNAIELSNIKRIKPHGLRHTYATLQLELGADIRTIAKSLGHKNTEQVKQVYGHIYDRNLIEAASNVDKAINNSKCPNGVQKKSRNKKSPI